jgi:hypothetical protein
MELIYQYETKDMILVAKSICHREPVRSNEIS